jgi:hypothetical protein
MVRSAADRVDAYLASLPHERRAVVAELRRLVLDHLPKGYVETMNWGMPSYEVPLDRYPTTYNGQPLGYVAFAAQKNNYALYLSCIYLDPARERALRDAFAAIGRKPDMGKACLRFRTLDGLPLETIGELIAATPVDEFIALHERSRAK